MVLSGLGIAPSKFQLFMEWDLAEERSVPFRAHLLPGVLARSLRQDDGAEVMGGTARTPGENTHSK